MTDSDSGSLASLTSAKRITTYTGTYYDDADRVIASTNFGTNDSGGFVAGGSEPDVDQEDGPPAGSLTTQTVYNARGLVDLSIDPEGKRTRFVYDDLNRRIAVIENDQASPNNVTVSWTGGSSGRWTVSGLSTSHMDWNRVTSFVYDGVGHVRQQIAHLPASGGGGEAVQVTEYVYGVTKVSSPSAWDSEISSNNLLFKVRYPDETDGHANTSASYTVTYAYNRQGELKYMKDQNGSEHFYSRDQLGRVIADQATKDSGCTGCNIDDTIVALGMTYDGFGRLESARSYSAYDPAHPENDVDNAVKFTYNGLWQVQNVWQEHNGDVIDSGGGTLSLKVEYIYDQMARSTSSIVANNYSRVLDLVYPDGNDVLYECGSSNNSDMRISRLTTIQTGSLGGPVNYDYIGMGMTAIMDYETPDVQLDRTVNHVGERDVAGSYLGYDKFGRVIRHMWVDGAFANADSPATRSNRPPIVELTHTYDLASNRLSSLNANAGLSKWSMRDWEYGYDGLDRLKQADRKGDVSGSYTFTPSNSAWTTSKAWTLDVLGNWRQLIADGDGDGPDGASPDAAETRSHNMANELTGQDLDSDNANDLIHAFDPAGNMATQEIGTLLSTPTTVTYTHDLWNRLVKVEYDSPPDVRVTYRYNALNWRIEKVADVGPGGVPDGTLDQKRSMYYSANWQLLHESIDDDLDSSDDRRMQYVWGPRYIDDLVMRRLDADANGSFADAGDKAYYHCTDSMFSTVAVLDSSANVLERVSYDPYGRARHHRTADCALGDGATNVNDQLLVINTWGASSPSSGDVNRDGSVNTNDLLAVIGDWGSGLALGRLSATDNVIGWDGYVFNAEISGGGNYKVRFRDYIVDLSRWGQRDPAGYVDSLNHFEFARSSPARYTDSLGLCCRANNDAYFKQDRFDVNLPLQQTIKNDPRYPTTTYPDGFTHRWRAAFHLSIDEQSCSVTIGIGISVTNPDVVTEAVLTQWKHAISKCWNDKLKFCCTGNNNCPDGLKFHLHIEFLAVGELGSHQEVTGTTGETEHAGLWGISGKRDICHEVGHLLGNRDEYYDVDGVNYGPGYQSGKGIMNNPNEDPDPRHLSLVEGYLNRLHGCANCYASRKGTPCAQ